MESLGNKLKTTREGKGYSYDYVSRETNIAVRYLEALEKEDFSCFPGEPYLLGFLKNYGDYLGLNPAELLSLYRALRIQEQPVPVEQLLHSPSPLPGILRGLFVTLLILGAAGGAVYFISRHLPQPEKPAFPPVRSPVEYKLEGDSLQRRFYQQDSVLIASGEGHDKLILSGLGEAITITTPEGALILDLGQEVRVDLNQDGTAELRISALDFDKGNSAAGAELRFELESYFAIPGEGSAAAPGNTAGTGARIIFEALNPYPFTMQAAFQGYCMFRWEVLRERDRPNRNQNYYQRTDEPLTVQAIQNGIRLWASNAQAVKVNVIGNNQTIPLDLGAAGEVVVVVDVRWIQDEAKRWRLALIRLD